MRSDLFDSSRNSLLRFSRGEMPAQNALSPPISISLKAAHRSVYGLHVALASRFEEDGAPTRRSRRHVGGYRRHLLGDGAAAASGARFCCDDERRQHFAACAMRLAAQVRVTFEVGEGRVLCGATSVCRPGIPSHGVGGSVVVHSSAL